MLARIIDLLNILAKEARSVLAIIKSELLAISKHLNERSTGKNKAQYYVLLWQSGNEQTGQAAAEEAIYPTHPVI